ncbi:hypothetical protein CBS101457_005984 [Exobasidium rhododendri]|nr:hypothetical protein CBS101457_005984 [Exobasidium rhododendri]
MSTDALVEKLALGEAPRGSRKPRVVVTGGSGKLGRAAVHHLSSVGWEVINFDLRRPPGAAEDGKTGIGGAYRLVEINLSDMGSVLEALMEIDMAYSGIDAIVHLAAMPSPGQSSSSIQFNTNVSSTYNILEAARKLKITNIVLASSETLIGIPFYPTMPSKLPITEENERRPESAYSLSKLVGEVMAEQYARWSPDTKLMSLRFSNVMLPEEYKDFEQWQDSAQKRYWNCWGYIDARDGAKAIELSLNSKMKGHHAYLIANNNTCMRMPNAELVKAVFPDVPYTPTEHPNGTLLDISKAKKDLGFEPQYDW